MPRIKKPSEKEKACNTCNEVKDLNDFYNDKNRPDGHIGCCISCSNVKKKAREAKKAEEAKNPVPKTETPKPTVTKNCSGCGECKTVDNFHRDGNKDDGFHTRCKKCREKEKKPKAEKPAVTEKCCIECEEVKKVEDFPKRGTGHRNMCKACTYDKYPPKKQEREDDAEYKCSTCKEMKKGCEFYDTASNMCAGCEGKRMHEARKTLDGALKELVGSARNRIKMVDNIVADFDLDFEYVKLLYKEQDGRCYYSGIEMTTNGQFKMSLERLDNSIGYLKSNVALCCLELNGMVQWSHLKIIDILDKNIDDNIVDLSKKKTKVYKDTPYDKNEYYGSPRGKIVGLANSAKHRAKGKKAKKHGRVLDFDLNGQFLIELFKEQKGLCAYSGLPLRFGKYKKTDWLVSLERIDVNRGYNKDNVCLVCLEFNATDHSAVHKYKSETSTGWSKDKFEFFMNTVRANLANIMNA